MIIIKKIVLKTVYLFLEKLYFFNLKNIYNKKVYVLDIDNTLTINKLGEKLNFIDPTPNLIIINELKDRIKNEEVVFLTARNIKLFSVTYKWLTEHQLIEKKAQLIVVENAESKLKYLELLLKQKNEILYYDDLSYNHENGSIKLYDSVIDKIKKLPLIYFGLEYLEKIKYEKNPFSN